MTCLINVAYPSQDIAKIHYFGMIKSTHQSNMNWLNINLDDKNWLIYSIIHYDIVKHISTMLHV